MRFFMHKAIDQPPPPIEPSTDHSNDASPAPSAPAKKKRKHRFRRFVVYPILFLIVAIAIARPMLPWAVRWYVNKVLSQNLLYEGRIGNVTLNLWRGAYTIDDIR